MIFKTPTLETIASQLEKVALKGDPGLEISSTTGLEDGVMPGARAGVPGHLKVAAGSVVYSRAPVTKDAPPASKVSGNPARAHAVRLKNVALPRRMDRLAERVGILEREVAELKGGAK